MSSNQMTLGERTTRLYEFLSREDIDKIRRHLKRQRSGGLSYEKFRSLLGRFDVVYPDEAFHNVCLKIDLDRDNVINWSEFIAYFILELQNDDNTRERLSIIPPIPNPASVLSSTQRSSAVRVLFDAASAPHGRYMTIGSLGDLYFWSTRWKLETIFHADDAADSSPMSIELSDKRQIKKTSKTLLLDAVVLADLGIICISSVGCDLRFYDVASAGKCNLRLAIKSFPSPLSALHSHCSIDDKNSKLILGDMVGSVRVIYLDKNFKSLFRESTSMRRISYHELMKDKIEAMKCTESIKIHHDIVRQVSFIASMNSFVSASESIISKSAYLPSVIIGNLAIRDSQVVFRMNSGATCFAFDEKSKTLATGGPDCILRLWNPVAPNQPKTILGSHGSGIMHIFMQDDGAKVYSMDKKKTIKIWDTLEERLLQTFTGLKTTFDDDIRVTALYNDSLREFVVASKKIATVKCKPRINLDKTDGFTLMAPVSLILYNELFHFLVTCSVSSTIIVWDVWKGRQVNLITRAHTRLTHGELQNVAITAGCFDPKHQFLLTAGDVTLKVWNFNEGLCLRTIELEGSQPVSQVFWTGQRIFAFGRTVNEFHDSHNYKEQINRGKIWRECHQSAIKCGSIRDPHVVVTSCAEGDLIFWRYETGQAYMRFNVQYPSQRLQIVYKRKDVEMRSEKRPRGRKDGENKTVKSSPSAETDSPTAQCMLSLNSRPLSASNGTLLVSLSSGRVQVWSHHVAAECCITDFDAIHVAGDVITAMTSDTQNCYLFTGSAKGYIKAWLIVDFCLSTSAVEKIPRVNFEKLFPFLERTDTEGRAKEAVRNQLVPQLLNSYQGHKGSITGLLFSERNQVLISSSDDKSVRLWHLAGQYIGTIGSPIEWRSISPNEPLPYDFAYRVPADLKHAISSTTLQVLEGGNEQTNLTLNQGELPATGKDATSVDVESVELAARPCSRILRRWMVKTDSKAEAQRRCEKPTLDISLPHIPVYSHLRIHPTVAINLPRTIPKCLETNNLPNLQYIFLEPDEIESGRTFAPSN